MRTKTVLIAISAVLFIGFNGVSQPFTLDEELKPFKLQLEDNNEYEGAKYIEKEAVINKGELDYYYVKGHDMYQFVDIFVFANKGNPNLEVSMVNNTWTNIEEIQRTKTSKEGIINFKVRSYQDIGFTIKSMDSDNVDYSIIVNASNPLMVHLGSPFIKATPQNTGSPEPLAVGESTASEIPIWLYGLIGLLLLIVGLFAGKLLGRKKIMPVILLLILTSFSNMSFGQTQQEEIEENANNRIEDIRNQIQRNGRRRGEINKAIADVNKAFKTADVAQDFLDKYKNLGSCLSSTPPPGQPRIPSFCEEDINTCASCFLNARKKFNEARYKLEKLQTIYDCTKAYTDAAISFGDNVSSYHGVTGLIWQAKRRDVEKSILKLAKSYDKKRIELLKELNESLIALNACENEHGLMDWYDRFGVMFYNFAEMRYHR